MLSLALLGCTAPPRQIALADLPEEVVWLAAIALDAEGQFSEGSGILSRQAEATWAAFSRLEGTLVVVGWSQRDLAKAAPLPAEGALAAARVRLSAPGAPALPAASWSGRGALSPGGLVRLSHDSGAPPALTADWLPDCILLEDRRAEVELRCMHCSAQLKQTGCDVEVETACPIGRVSATFDGRGDLRFGEGQSLERCSLRPGTSTSGGQRSYSCETTSGLCDLDLYEGQTPPLFAPTSLSLLGERPFVENVGRATDSPSIRGYLSSMALTTAGLVVAGQPSPRTWACAQDTTVADKSGSFYFIAEGPGPRLTRTATAPPCVSALLPDPAGPGFLAVFGLGPQRLGRFGAEGQWLADVEIPAAPPEARWVLSAALSRDRSRVLLLLAQSDGRGRPSAAAGLAVQLDARSLAVLTPPVGTADHSEAVVAAGPQDFLVFEGDDAGGVLVDSAGPHLEIESRVPGCSPPDGDFGVVRAAALDEARILLGARGVQPLLLLVERDRPVCGVAVPFEHELEPYAVAPWPGHQRRALFGAQSRGQDGYVGVLDTERARVLRGATLVGRGQVTELLTTQSGGIWALLPGSATIAWLGP